jgi:hypothetical protein
MGIELIYPTINLFQYNLRQGLGDDNAKILAQSRSFYQKFLPDLQDLELYRQREQPDREFNQLLYTDRSSLPYQSLSQPLDGFYYPIQLGDTYALHLNCSGKLVGGKPDKRPKDYQIAVSDLELVKILPPLDGYSFGQTILMTAFIEDIQVDKLKIAKSCDRQITGKSANDLPRLINHGEWMDGELFEFWTPPQSLQGDNLQQIINNYPHTIIWLFPAAKLDEIDREIIPNTYQDWIRLLHYRHKTFYAYFQSRSIEQQLKQANKNIGEIADRLKSQARSLPYLQNLLVDTLSEFQSYSKNTQELEDQQYTIEIDRENYRSRCEEMTKADANCDLQFLLEFDTKYSNKYNRQISADRNHLDSGLKVLENLSQTIQGTIQIERAKSDRTTNLTIAAFGSGLAISQVVSAIIIAQTPQDRIKNLEFYHTNAFEKSLIYGSMPILLLVIYLCLAWAKSHKGK